MRFKKGDRVVVYLPKTTRRSPFQPVQEVKYALPVTATKIEASYILDNDVWYYEHEIGSAGESST